MAFRTPEYFDENEQQNFLPKSFGLVRFTFSSLQKGKLQSSSRYSVFRIILFFILQTWSLVYVALVSGLASPGAGVG